MWIALDCCERRRRSLNVFFGDTYGTEISQATFRRQHPFEDYVLDFYCPSAKLAIELDGGGHNYRAGQTRDRTRSEFLARHGVIVLRFWNHQVRRELDSVLRAIWFALGEQQRTNPHLHPLPSPTPLPSLALARPSLPKGESAGRGEV